MLMRFSMENTNEELASPCIRNCCLDNNDICLGCDRHVDDIIGWAEKPNAEKKRILALCQQRQRERKTS